MPQDFERTAAGWSRGAVAQVTQDGETTIRPALFVLELEGGALAWIEPSYLDDMGAASPGLHVAGQAVDVTPPGAPLAYFAAAGSGWSVVVYPVDEEDPQEVREALAWALGELEARGTTWAAERARLAAEIS
jgi:hypothetical protein